MSTSPLSTSTSAPSLLISSSLSEYNSTNPLCVLTSDISELDCTRSSCRTIGQPNTSVCCSDFNDKDYEPTALTSSSLVDYCDGITSSISSSTSAMSTQESTLHPSATDRQRSVDISDPTIYQTTHHSYKHTPSISFRGFIRPGAMGSSILRTLILIMCSSMIVGPITATLDISAFEYHRKFNSELNLGDCPQREVRMNLGNDTKVEEQRCNLQYTGPVTHKDRRMKDTRNKIINSSQDVVNNLGLCGGEAASFLGILNSGDCISIEIASRLTFNEKTLVRAFIGYYRKSLDMLEDKTEKEEKMLQDGRERYYSDKLYLKNRSYGTLEVIFVQFRFKNASLAQAASAVDLSPHTKIANENEKKMSNYMMAINKATGEPKTTTVITLSTASQKGYDIEKFPDFRRALRHVQIKEGEMMALNNEIDSKRMQPHLQYTFDYFLKSQITAGFRTNDKKPWEESSLLEVDLRKIVQGVKKYTKRCRSKRMKVNKECRRIKELRRKMQKTQQVIHTFRSDWHNKTEVEKSSFLTKYNHQVNAYRRTPVTKDVKKMFRRMKLEKMKEKNNRNNQIPTPPSVLSPLKIKSLHRQGKGIRPTGIYGFKNRKNRTDRKDRKRKGKGRRRNGRRGKKHSSNSSATQKKPVFPRSTSQSQTASSTNNIDDVTTTHVTRHVTRDNPRRRRPSAIGTSNVRVIEDSKRSIASSSRLRVSPIGSRSRGNPVVSRDNPKVSRSSIVKPIISGGFIRTRGSPILTSRSYRAMASRSGTQDVRLTREPPAIRRGYQHRPTPQIITSSSRNANIRVGSVPGSGYQRATEVNTASVRRGRIGLISPTSNSYNSNVNLSRLASSRLAPAASVSSVKPELQPSPSAPGSHISKQRIAQRSRLTALTLASRKNHRIRHSRRRKVPTNNG